MVDWVIAKMHFDHLAVRFFCDRGQVIPLIGASDQFARKCFFRECLCFKCDHHTPHTAHRSPHSHRSPSHRRHARTTNLCETCVLRKLLTSQLDWLCFLLHRTAPHCIPSFSSTSTIVLDGRAGWLNAVRQRTDAAIFSKNNTHFTANHW